MGVKSYKSSTTGETLKKHGIRNTEGRNSGGGNTVNQGMQTFWQKLEGTTDQVLTEIGRLIDEGNIRRVVVKQRGRTVAEFPVTVGVIGAVLAPLAAAIGALAAVLSECSIEVERTAGAATDLSADARPPATTETTGGASAPAE